LEIKDKTIFSRKQRETEEPRPVGFALEQVVLGRNQYGKEVQSCVIATHDAELANEFVEVKLPKQAKVALQVLRDLINRDGKQPEEADDARVFGVWANVGVWRELSRGTISSGNMRAQNLAFTRARNILEKAGVVKIYEDFAWLT
jgi:hypothetical protein